MEAAATAEKTLNVPMMLGSSTGYSYMAFAKRGNVALAIKPNAIADGAGMYPSMPGTTYIGARLRSAPASTVQWVKEDGETTDDPAANVVSFAASQDSGLKDTWPEVIWEKVRLDDRCSTQIGVFLRGSLKENPEALSAEFDDKKLANKMTDYLITLAGGEEYLTVPKRTLRDWIASVYNPQIANVLKSLENQKLAQAKAEEKIGTFGMQSALLKEIHQAQSGHDTPVEDVADTASDGHMADDLDNDEPGQD